MCPKSFTIENDLSRENLRLKFAVEELSILNDIATAIASTQSLDQITNLIVKKCVKHLKSEQGSIQLVDEKDFTNPFHTMIRVMDSQMNIDALRFDQQIAGKILSNKKPILINEFHHEENISLPQKPVLKIRNMLSVPMVIKGKMIGILSLFNKKSETGFTEADQKLLSIIATQSVQVIENARLFEEEKRLLEIQKELQVARDIQKNLLPKDIPNINEYDIYAINIPVKEVGGDYYDFIKITDTKTAIALGDVSGKGLPASMLMANLQATLRGQLLFSSCVRDCIERANNLLYKSTDETKFVTCFFGILDTEKNTLTFCNAGHNEAVLVKDNKKIMLDIGGLPLGCFEDANYSEGKILFDRGSTVVVFSDGITEAMNENEEQYGEERLYEFVEKKSELSSRHLANDIIWDLKKFISGMSQSDDITLMIIKRDA